MDESEEGEQPRLLALVLGSAAAGNMFVGLFVAVS